MLYRRPSARAAVAAVYALSMFMSIMDTQIVNVALATLSRDFAATTAQVQWVVTGYLLSMAVSIPASGWLGDRFGTTRVFLLSLVLFGAASALCAAAQDLPVLVLARVVQGVGGGLMMPVGMTMLYRAYPLDQRVRIARLVTLVAIIAPATAPVIGGVLVTKLSWHWIFLINVPLALGALLFGLAFLPREALLGSTPFDWSGFMLSGVGLAALLYAVSVGPSDGWGSPTVWGPGLAGVVLLAVFTRHSLRSSSPVLRLGLLRDRMFGLCCALTACSTVAFFGSLVFTALYLQEGRGVSALTSGLTTFPEAVGIGLTSQLVARLYPRVGPRRLIMLAFAGLAAVNVVLSTAGPGTSLWLVRGLMFAIGVSVSFVMLPVQAGAYARLPVAETGQASAIYTAIQRAGSALGVALLTVVLALGTGHRVLPPVSAFPAVYLTSAGLAVLGGLLALAVRDSDALGPAEP